jgi:hypothetical protein
MEQLGKLPGFVPRAIVTLALELAGCGGGAKDPLGADRVTLTMLLLDVLAA